jgi:hypothetical protein
MGLIEQRVELALGLERALDGVPTVDGDHLLFGGGVGAMFFVVFAQEPQALRASLRIRR